MPPPVEGTVSASNGSAASSVSLFPIGCATQRALAGLVGVDRGRLGTGLGARRLLHHQKPPPPSNATKTMPMMASLIAQPIASFAIRKKITRITTPPIMKIVVKLILLPAAYCFRWLARTT